MSIVRISVLVLLLLAGNGCARSAKAPAEPAPADSLDQSYRKAAGFILGLDGVGDRGYCLVFGAGEGRLARELASRSRYRLLGVEEDPAKVERGREALREANLYGSRITLHQHSLDKLRYRDYAAVLVVSDSIIADGKCSGSAAEMFRMVRPDGGLAVVGQPANCANVLARSELEEWLKAGAVRHRIVEREGLWAIVERGPLPGAGEWTHSRGDVANTLCSGDARTNDRYKVLWFGEPGPRVMIDRHWKSVSPLYKNGRMFTPAHDRIICSDAYNGARLWDLELPKSSRIAALREAGWLALADDYLYAAVLGSCLKVDVRNGEKERFFDMPEGRQMGYVAVQGDLLYGSEQARGGSHLAAFTGGGRSGNRLTRGDNQPIPTSTKLFCRNRHTGRTIWSYEPDKTVVANVTISVGDDAVYFFESTSPASVASANGRTKLSDFTHEAHEHLVKLDNRTGEVVWRRHHELTVNHILYLSYAKGMLVASGTTDGEGVSYRYHAWGFDAAKGNQVWKREFDRDAARRKPGRDWSHGKQDKQGLIIGNGIYFSDAACDLRSGKPLKFKFKTSGCSEYSASAGHIFGRGLGGVAGFWNISGDEAGLPLSSATRPGCGVSIISGGGLVMMPPFGAGCMCAYTIETTLAWLPVDEEEE